MERSGKRAVRAALLAVLLIGTMLLSGCGQRLVMTRGYGKEELFRIGNTRCMIQEYNVFLLNLQKACERTFGHEVWEGPSGADLAEAIEQRALSEASRLKVMLLLAVQDNIMLTDAEESLADEAETEYYEGLSEEERSIWASMRRCSANCLSSMRWRRKYIRAWERPLRRDTTASARRWITISMNRCGTR